MKKTLVAVLLLVLAMSAAQAQKSDRGGRDFPLPDLFQVV